MNKEEMAQAIVDAVALIEEVPSPDGGHVTSIEAVAQENRVMIRTSDGENFLAYVTRTNLP